MYTIMISVAVGLLWSIILFLLVGPYAVIVFIVCFALTYLAISVCKTAVDTETERLW